MAPFCVASIQFMVVYDMWPWYVDVIRMQSMRTRLAGPPAPGPSLSDDNVLLNHGETSAWVGGRELAVHCQCSGYRGGSAGATWTYDGTLAAPDICHPDLPLKIATADVYPVPNADRNPKH